MRLVLLALTVLMGGAAFTARQRPGVPDCRMQIREQAPVAKLAAADREVVTTEVSASFAPVATVSVRMSPKAESGLASPLVYGPDPLLGVLTRLLELNSLQQAQIQEILAERAMQVAAYEQEVARRGWAKLSDFEQRITDIRDLAHRRVMALLNAMQATSYGRAVAAGIPEDHLSIELPENVVSLD